MAEVRLCTNPGTWWDRAPFFNPHSVPLPSPLFCVHAGLLAAAPISMHDSFIFENLATGNGGGIALQPHPCGSSFATLTDTVIESNKGGCCGDLESIPLLPPSLPSFYFTAHAPAHHRSSTGGWRNLRRIVWGERDKCRPERESRPGRRWRHWHRVRQVRLAKISDA